MFKFIVVNESVICRFEVKLGILDKIDGKLIHSFVRDRSFIKSQGWGVQFSKRLDFGGSILEMHKMLGGSKYYDTGLAFYEKVAKLYWD